MSERSTQDRIQVVYDAEMPQLDASAVATLRSVPGR